MFDLISLQGALNLTSSLLKDMNDIQQGDLGTNILVSCDKLEKFAVQYAKYHMTSENNSQAEVSIEEDEIGEGSAVLWFLRLSRKSAPPRIKRIRLQRLRGFNGLQFNCLNCDSLRWSHTHFICMPAVHIISFCVSFLSRVDELNKLAGSSVWVFIAQAGRALQR